MTVPWGIEMFTLEQDAQLLELMRWRKELRLAGFQVEQYVLNLCDDHTDLLGSPTQLVGLVIDKGNDGKRTLYMHEGRWTIRAPIHDWHVSFEEGVQHLKEFMEIP